MSLEDLRQLHAKYLELIRLRSARELIEAAGGHFAPDDMIGRRDAFRRLAASFPGSLRELDETRRVVLLAKASAVAEEIERVAAGGRLERPWIAITIDFHKTLGRLLKLKREGSLERPAGGRLMTLVWAELEERHGLPRARLEDLVYGPQA
jgi:hypothetical protein